MNFPDPIEELLRLCQTLEVPQPLTREEGEAQLVETARRGDWEEMLELLRRLPHPVSPEPAALCLSHSIHSAPLPVCLSLLDALPRMEYIYQRTYPLTRTPDREESRPWNIDVYASPVTHAAAENRPDLLKALLERGFDDTPMCRFSLRPWHSTKNHVPALDWEDAVPLALTLLMGHTQCAQILLEQGVPDVENIPGVSRSLYLCWREADEDYRQTCRLLPAHRPVLRAMAEACSPGQLRQVLDRYPYSPEELTQAARQMLQAYPWQAALWADPTQRWPDLCRKLILLGQVCPEVLLDREVTGELLNLCSNRPCEVLNPFLPFFQGQRLDLSQSLLFQMVQPNVQNIIKLLSAHCTLVIERDAISPATEEKVIRFLLKHVTLLPAPAHGGISGLTQAILRCGNMGLLRKALQTGIIPPEESTPQLLAYQKNHGISLSLRPVLLTTSRPHR